MNSLTTALLSILFLPQVIGECNYGNSLSFSKISGFAPILPSSPIPLYNAAPGTAITAECYNRCKSSTDCSGFIVDYNQSSCYRVPEAYNYSGALTYAPEVSYFTKVCLPAPSNCSDRAWSLDYTPGYELVGLQFTVLTNISDRWDCGAACLRQNSTADPCLSANFNPVSRTCSLSSHTRWTNPDSFVPTAKTQSEYIENQCIGPSPSPCWHDPINNYTSYRTDLQLFNTSLEECRKRCTREIYFTCRGFSYIWASSSAPSQCLLHSDTLLMAVGPTLQPQLTSTFNSVYSEIIECIDLSVTCDEEDLHLTLNSPKFIGRMFVQGYSETCGAQGRGQNVTVLSLPMPKVTYNPCGITSAFDIGPVYNRTLVSTIVVVQYHQLIQTVNDRVIRVNCLLTEGPPATTPSSNLLNATFSIQEPQAQTEISGIGGTVIYNGTAAKATMRILDKRTGLIANDVQLGDPLQLRITIDPPFNVSIIRASHLIATSGSQQDSLLLLDGRGCPPDVTTFPALRPIDANNLVADFKAFRFPSSPVLMLSIVLTICSEVCQPTDCGNGVLSYGRRKREVYKAMPLQLAIFVHDQNILSNNASHLQGAEIGGYGNSESETGRSDSSGQICTNFLTLALIVLFLFLLQCIIIAIFCAILHRQKEKHIDTISLRHDFQPRHVTWADDTEIPSKSLRLSTPVKT